MSKNELNDNDEFDEESSNIIHSISIKLLNDIEEILESQKLDNQSKINSLSNLFSTTNLPFLNKNIEKQFFNVLENLRKKNKLDDFIEIFQKANIKNLGILFILKNAFLSEHFYLN